MMSTISRITIAVVQSIMETFSPIYIWVIKKILSLIYDRSATCVPPTNDKILLYTATQLAEKIRSRELTAVKVLETYIQRVKVVNPIINAVVVERFDKALEEARVIDTILDQANIDSKYSLDNMPFLGVPVSIKECFALAGYPSTTGLVARKGMLNTTDAPVVSNLKSAGFIPFVLTNVSELCMWYESSNYLYGTTCNAYDTSRIVGGSSGGEACNISAAGSVVGLGSDIGGSIRMPAFFNGVFGHKPTYGIVNNSGQYPTPMSGEGTDDSVLTTGPICRYASDLIPLLKVMGGPAVSKLKLETPVNFKDLVIFTMEDMGGGLLVSKVDQELKDIQRKVEQHFEENLGVRVNRIHLEDMKYFLEIWTAEMQIAGGHSFRYFLSNETGDVNAYWELFKWIFRFSNHTLAAIGLAIMETVTLNRETYKPFLQKSKDLRHKMLNILSDDSVFLFPTHPRICPYHNQPLFHPFDFPYTAGFNALKLPVTQCPLGLSKDGHPMGIQVVTSPFNDHLSLAVAREIENSIGGWVMPGINGKFKSQ